jgi:hypothetical protein
MTPADKLKEKVAKLEEMLGLPHRELTFEQAYNIIEQAKVVLATPEDKLRKHADHMRDFTKLNPAT